MFGITKTNTNQNALTNNPDNGKTVAKYFAPPVDILESKDSYIIKADMPGVMQESLSVDVKDGVLTLEGEAQSTMSDDRVYSEFELVNYHRKFELSEKVDAEQITADLKHGVLSITLLKAEEAKPRQIKIKYN
jgi:HSP20 family protein